MSMHLLRLTLAILVVPALAIAGWYIARQPIYNLEKAIGHCASLEDTKLQCYQALLLQVLEERGLPVALELTALLFERDADFASQCHGNMHELGQAMYTRYVSEKRLELPSGTPYCGFGFFHGFFDELVLQEGDPEGAGRFCRALDTGSRQKDRTVISCFHGIGHGISDGTNPRSWGSEEEFVSPSLSICKQISRNERERGACASGVFNSLALAYRDPKYGFRASPDDPYAFCRSLGEEAFRRSCFDQMNSFALSGRTLQEGIDLVRRSVPTPYWRYAVNGLATTAVRDVFLAGGDVVPLSAVCASMPQEDAVHCIRSVVGGIFEFGQPSAEYKEAVRFCSSPMDFQEACVAGFISGITDSYTPDMQEKACALLADAVGDAQASSCASALAKRQMAETGRGY